MESRSATPPTLWCSMRSIRKWRSLSSCPCSTPSNAGAGPSPERRRSCTVRGDAKHRSVDRFPAVLPFFETDNHPKTLGDRGFASTDGLPDLETLELRMVDVERLVLAGILVGGAKCLRLGPRFEGTPVPPDRMRGIEREVLVLGSLQQVEFDEARHLVELRVAAEPHLLECLF